MAIGPVEGGQVDLHRRESQHLFLPALPHGVVVIAQVPSRTVVEKALDAQVRHAAEHMHPFRRLGIAQAAPRAMPRAGIPFAPALVQRRHGSTTLDVCDQAIGVGQQHAAQAPRRAAADDRRNEHGEIRMQTGLAVAGDAQHIGRSTARQPSIQGAQDRRAGKKCFGLVQMPDLAVRAIPGTGPVRRVSEGQAQAQAEAPAAHRAIDDARCDMGRIRRRATTQGLRR